MKCSNCGQASPWWRDASDWTPIRAGGNGVHRLLECDRCGHRQQNR